MTGPLEGLRVLDATTAWAGPYCTMILADMGADVIKIENSQEERSESFSSYPPFFAGQNAVFMLLNRNKRSFTVNLKDPRGQEALLRLAERSDVFVQNFRSGVVQRLGVDYETMRGRHPGIIYCSIAGYGAGSPYESLPVLNVLAEAFSGFLSMTGEPGREPCSSGENVADLGAGLMAALGIVVAYLHRLKTGQGQHVEASLADLCISWLISGLLMYDLEGKIAEPMGSGSSHRMTRGNQAYRCRDGRYVAVMAGDTRSFKRLCQAIGLNDMAADPRFATYQSRLDNGEAMIGRLQESFATRTRDEWVQLLRDKDIGVAPVNDVAEALNDPHVAARELLVTLQHPAGGPFRHLATPLKMSETPPTVRTLAPNFGGDTESLLRWLGYRECEVAALRQDRVV